MKAREKGTGEFKVTEKLKARAVELLDESQAMQFAEGLRLNNTMAHVFNREEKRLRQKYGPDDPRTKEMSFRVEGSAEAKADLFSRYSDAMTPQTMADKGWAVDGFVRTVEGRPAGGLNVAAYDKDGNIHKELGTATTDERGFFAIKVDKFPEKPPAVVFMRASKGRTLLPSKEVRLAPAAGASERVEIILTDKSGDKPEKPQQPDKPPVVVTERPPQPDRTTVPAAEKPQPDKISLSTLVIPTAPSASQRIPASAIKPKAKAKAKPTTKKKAATKKKTMPRGKGEKGKK